MMANNGSKEYPLDPVHQLQSRFFFKNCAHQEIQRSKISWWKKLHDMVKGISFIGGGLCEGMGSPSSPLCLPPIFLHHS